MKKDIDVSLVCEMSFRLGRIYNLARTVNRELDKFGKTLSEEDRECLDEIEKMQDEVCNELTLDNIMYDLNEE